MPTNTTETTTKRVRTYSAGLRAGKGKTIADLLAVIRAIAGMDVLAYGKTTVKFRADAAAKKQLIAAAGDFCVVGLEAVFRPAQR